MTCHAKGILSYWLNFSNEFNTVEEFDFPYWDTVRKNKLRELLVPKLVFGKWKICNFWLLFMWGIHMVTKSFFAALLLDWLRKLMR